ncbi:acylphosphatase [Roseibium sp.]|uniref:acylphosphatase n=1 Tax=Roseibium sp. TaxID=1936156 RepID=UPI003A96BC85
MLGDGQDLGLPNPVVMPGTAPDDPASVYVTVMGRVQGVGYRAWCAQEAERLGLFGWIRNRSDGTVEAIYHGPAKRIVEMVRLAQKGPALAEVTKMLASPCNAPDNASFQRRPTF